MPYNRTIMLQKFHAEIIKTALGGRFSAAAIESIIAANVYQDRLAGQIGHDEYHFDNNAFEKSYAYMEEQRVLVISSLHGHDPASAWAAFGRLTHTAQDFYAHSNYIDLWLSRFTNGTRPPPPEVDPMDRELLDAPALRSGRIYLLELFSLIPGLKRPVLALLPRDAHGWMNLDSPEQGPSFAFAFHAAVKRTVIEFEKTKTALSHDLLDIFVEK